jgi:ABC-type nitrate/sulfonate/bicarbonate transport system substrate-binding protein
VKFNALRGLAGKLVVLMVLCTHTANDGTAWADIRLVYPEGTGARWVFLHVAEDQGIFKKHGVPITVVPVRGATVPTLSNETPLGVIGHPAALLQAVGGNDLRIVSSFNRAMLTGHLVARAEIKAPDLLRGKRVGVRVVGAGIWIQTMLALDRLGLDPVRDGITAVAIGNPAEIVRALEDGKIDAALVSTQSSRQLRAKGFSVLLNQYPPNLGAFESGLVVWQPFLRDQRAKVESTLKALLEAVDYVQAASNKTVVLEALARMLRSSDASEIESAYRSLSTIERKPYPAIDTLKSMQQIMAIHEPKVLGIAIESLVDDRVLRELDAPGFLGQPAGR